MMNSRYALDRKEAKVFGVCAGLARSTGWDLLLIRLGAVALTLFAFGPLVLIAYFVTFLVAQSH